MISQNPNKIEINAMKNLKEEKILIVSDLLLWRNGVQILWVFCETSRKAQVGELLFPDKSVILTDVLYAGFVLVYCCSLLFILLPFIIL